VLFSMLDEIHRCADSLLEQITRVNNLGRDVDLSNHSGDYNGVNNHTYNTASK